MARIRTIKPEFWTDGAMVGLSIPARLFYIGTWNFTLCDQGHLPDDPMGLKLRIMPADDIDPAALVAELVDAGRLVRIVTPDDRTFLYVRRFVDHQKLDTRWNSRCPACAQLTATELTETHASLDELTGTRSRRGGEGKGKDSKGGESPSDLSPFCTKHPNGTDDPCRACGRARIAHEIAVKAAKNKPTTPGIVTDPDCPKHPNRPARDCDRCKEEAVS